MAHSPLSLALKVRHLRTICVSSSVLPKVGINLPKLKDDRVQMICRSVGHSDMQADIFAVINFDHGTSCLVHQLLSETEATVLPLDCERSDVTMRLIVVFFPVKIQLVSMMKQFWLTAQSFR